MRPWIHIPLLVLLISLATGVWVLMREVPVDRQGTKPVLAAEMPSPFVEPTPGGVLEGTLMDSEGVPQAFADLSTLQDGRVLWTHSDENGNFRLEGLQDGPLEVAVLANDHLPETLAVAGPREKIQLSMQLPVTPAPELALLEKSPWRGRIRNPHYPSELQGFEVWLNPVGPAQEVTSGVPRRAMTNKEGRFEFPDLIHTEYSLCLLAPDSKGGMGPDLLVAMGADSQTLVHDGSPITAELTTQGGGLKGVVLAGTAPDRRPAAAAMVMITALTQGTGDGAVQRVLPALLTDRAGRWSTKNLQPGRYRVRVRGGGLAAETVVDVEANQDQTVVFPD
ncbi:MAG: carboxypeptidase regulatory-like domain-containing protein [bacterium]|nr:carboxypeptidase regulatory-like domain-containing protein [bacterium]